MAWRLPTRPLLGLVLQGAAIVAAITILAGTVVGWRILGAVEDVVDRAERVSLAALEAVDASLRTADDLLMATRSTLAAATDTLRTVEGSFDQATDALGSVSDLTETAAPALASAQETLGTLEGVGRTIDRTLEALSRVPFGPDYDPDQGFGVTISRLADDLGPLPETLRSTADELDGFVDRTRMLAQDLDPLTTALEQVAAELENSDELLASYRAAAAEARQLADDTGAGLGVDLAIGRVVLTLGGIGLAAGQAVPFLWGARMRAGG